MIKGTSFFSVFLGFSFAVWLVTLWILSSLPGQDVHLPAFPESDKVAHFFYFFVGGLLLVLLTNGDPSCPLAGCFSRRS